MDFTTALPQRKAAVPAARLRLKALGLQMPSASTPLGSNERGIKVFSSVFTMQRLLNRLVL
jgi:hypothetical protein